MVLKTYFCATYHVEDMNMLSNYFRWVAAYIENSRCFSYLLLLASSYWIYMCVCVYWNVSSPFDLTRDIRHFSAHTSIPAAKFLAGFPGSIRPFLLPSIFYESTLISLKCHFHPCALTQNCRNFYVDSNPPKVIVLKPS